MLVMFGIITFTLLLPLALARHNVLLGTTIGVIFVLYIGANVMLWRRLKPRV